MGMFIRENRYVVIKKSDMDKYIPHSLLECDIEVAQSIINDGREDDGKPPLSCVVIESDWPEYETVWKMLEDRCKGEQQ